MQTTQNENDINYAQEYDAEVLHQYEKADLALRSAANELQSARSALDYGLCHELTANIRVRLETIQGLLNGILPTSSPPVMCDYTPAYRTGLICSVDGASYWHTGATYHVALGNPAGPQVDLRCMPGFKEVQTRFDMYNALLLGEEWRRAAAAEPGIAQALDILYKHSEQLWWDAVNLFLRNHKASQDERIFARQILLSNGFDIQAASRLIP